NMTQILIPTAISMVIIWFLVWFITHRELNEGVGKASKILIPLLFVLMAFIILYALTLPGAYIGINALLTPEWSLLFDVNIWLAAFSQIVFTLSMGESISLTYASYLPEGSKLADNVLIVVFANCAFELVTAFGIFSILGYMTYTSGTPLTQLVSEGTGLVFVVLPRIFEAMGPIGHVLAPMLFISILFAGITSSMAELETLINSLYHKIGWSRKKIVTLISIFGCMLSLLFTTAISSYLINVVDGFLTEFWIILLIILQCIIFTWFYDIENVIPILNENNRLKVGKTWVFILKYILPVFLSFLWINGVYNLAINSNNFEITIYILITVLILIVSYIFTNINKNHD
ncbi:MAG: sodium-dependent transporter, partial [Methanobrevibacter sp.]|nr:sodium-dependent transporter [Methanobrevibacter sp.]